jgi:hypothetical protein
VPEKTYVLVDDVEEVSVHEAMLTLGSWDDCDADGAAEDCSGCVVDTAGGVDADEPECPSSLLSFQTAGMSATTMAHTPATTALASVKTPPTMATLTV